MLISIDMGKANLKSFNGSQSFQCASTYAEGIEKLNSGYQVTIKDKTYLIGDTTLNYNYDLTKELEQHRMLMYLAIFNLVPTNEKVTVFTTCPLDTYLNKELRKSFKTFLLENSFKTVGIAKMLQPITLTVDSITKSFYLEDVKVYPESNGIVYNAPQLFHRKLVGVVDIGGVTINYAVFENLNLVRSDSFTENNGMHYLRKEIRDALKKATGKNITDLEISSIINEKRYPNIVEPVITHYLTRIKTDLTAHKWSDDISLVFTGGGALELQEFIVTYFNNATISSSAVLDNCYGTYKLGELICQKKKN